MFTQCEHCKAVFRVNMREVTVAKGKLRCGECDHIFNATQSLSTTIPKTFQASVTEKKAAQSSSDTPVSLKKLKEQNNEKTGIKETKYTEVVISSDFRQKIPVEKKSFKPNWLLITALLLVALLASQILYNNKHIILGTALHQPEKIQVLNHNIFAHPSESGVLLISASIKNTAEQAQPYPVLELSLEDSQSKTIALRRFLPKEYLDNYSESNLMPSNQAINLRLKIKDPGSTATHFQIDFL